MTNPTRNTMGKDSLWDCAQCGASYCAFDLARDCCVVEPEPDRSQTGANGTKNYGDCHHGIPVNLICGACNAEQRSDIDATLKERGNRYGEFPEHARITQNLKSAMNDSPNWSTLPADMREALEMVAHKIGRILNGDPDYHDSWHDIIGYTKLVADRLEGE